MKEAKRGKCEKCGILFYIESHHILPKAQFGEKGDKANLCPNCHRLVHEDMKKEIADPTNAEEIKEWFRKWLAPVCIAAFLIASCLLVF